AQLGEVGPGQVDAGHAPPGVLVVGGRHGEEANAARSQRPHRGDDVVGAKRDVLHAGGAVVVEVLLDLALVTAGGRLVDRHHDAAAVPHHGRHQRRVLGTDLLVVEVGQLVEPE